MRRYRCVCLVEGIYVCSFSANLSKQNEYRHATRCSKAYAHMMAVHSVRTFATQVAQKLHEATYTCGRGSKCLFGEMQIEWRELTVSSESKV